MRPFADSFGCFLGELGGWKLHNIGRIRQRVCNRLGIFAQRRFLIWRETETIRFVSHSRPSAVARISSGAVQGWGRISSASCAAYSSGGYSRSSTLRRATAAALSSRTPSPKTMPQANVWGSPAMAIR